LRQKHDADDHEADEGDNSDEPSSDCDVQIVLRSRCRPGSSPLSSYPTDGGIIQGRESLTVGSVDVWGM
jgi:hypothetical protein